MNTHWKLCLILATGTLSALAVLAGTLPHRRLKPARLHSDNAPRPPLAAVKTISDAAHAATVDSHPAVTAEPISPQAATAYHAPLHYIYLDPHQDELNRQAKASRMLRQQALRASQRQQALDAAPRYCELHGELLKPGTATIGYGLPGLSYCEAERKWFPHGHESVNGGCMVTPGAPQTATVRYCQRCRDAEDQWRQAETARINQLEAELERRGHL